MLQIETRAMLNMAQNYQHKIKRCPYRTLNSIRTPRLVPMVGLEPTWFPARFWVWCVCQFRHIGAYKKIKNIALASHTDVVTQASLFEQPQQVPPHRHMLTLLSYQKKSKMAIVFVIFFHLYKSKLLLK